MSNPFSVLDLSDDERITVVKPVAAAAAAPAKPVNAGKAAASSSAPGKPRKELQKEEANLQQKKKPSARNTAAQTANPNVTHPGERSKLGLKKEEHVKTNKRVDAAGVDARGTRTFDRHSGTGRGREVRKAGAGARNWGKPGDEAGAPAAAGAEGAAAAATEAAEAEPVVEEEPQLTLADYEAQKLAKRSGAAFADKQVRKVTPAAEFTAFKKEDSAYIQLGETKEKKTNANASKESKKKVFEADFKIAREPEAAARSFGSRDARPASRDEKPARGPARSAAAPAGARNQAPIDTADQSAFPKLGA